MFALHQALKECRIKSLLTLAMHGMSAQDGYHFWALVAKLNLVTAQIIVRIAILVAMRAYHAHYHNGAFGLKVA